jgi:hypothetical protein
MNFFKWVHDKIAASVEKDFSSGYFSFWAGFFIVGLTGGCIGLNLICDPYSVVRWPVWATYTLWTFFAVLWFAGVETIYHCNTYFDGDKTYGDAFTHKILLMIFVAIALMPIFGWLFLLALSLFVIHWILIQIWTYLATVLVVVFRLMAGAALIAGFVGINWYIRKPKNEALHKAKEAEKRAAIDDAKQHEENGVRKCIENCTCAWCAKWGRGGKEDKIVTPLKRPKKMRMSGALKREAARRKKARQSRNTFYNI